MSTIYRSNNNNNDSRSIGLGRGVYPEGDEIHTHTQTNGNVSHKLRMEKTFLSIPPPPPEKTTTRITPEAPPPDGIAVCRLLSMSLSSFLLPKTRNLHLGIEFLGISFNAYPNTTKHMEDVDVGRTRAYLVRWCRGRNRASSSSRGR